MRSTSGSPSSRTVVGRVLDSVILLLFCLPALQPLLTDVLTCGYDNVFHLWRSVQIEALWQQGVLYSRWAPAMAHGLGFPLYLFASPFPPALVALLHQSGLTWAVAMNAVFALGMLLGGLTMMKLARELFGDAAGWVAGIAYVYAPFQAYDVFNRGSLWEAFAWAWPPLVLWGLHRWVRWKDRRGLGIGTGALVAMVLSHHLFAFLFAPLLVVWVFIVSLQRRDVEAIGRGAILGLLGLGLTAFFWLPPVVERAYVQTGRLLGTWVFDYRANFLPIEHLLALPRRADPALLNDWPQKSLGLVPVLMGLSPLLLWRTVEQRRRGLIVGLMGLTLLFAALTLQPTQFLWDRLPLLSYVQFPWRYLGPAALCLSLLIGAGTSAGVARLQGISVVSASIMPVFVMVMLVLANLGWFFPRHCPPPPDISVPAMIRWELTTDTIGTTAKGEYLPIWTEQLAAPASLLDDYDAGVPPTRLSKESLPEGATVHEAAYRALGATIRLTSPEPFTARYMTLYYPGWRVSFDGEPIPIAPEPESGLLTFPVPAGTHELKVAFGETPLRWAADAVSGLSLLGLVGLFLALSKSERPTRTGHKGTGSRKTALLAGVVLIALKLGVIDQQPWLWRASRLREDGSLRDVEVPMMVNFGDRAMLLGRDGMQDSLPSGATGELTLYWRAISPGTGDWHVGLSLTGLQGTVWPVSLRPTRWGRTPPPMQAWPPDTYARMDKLVDLPAGMPPGVYTPTLSLFDRRTLAPASVLGSDGNPLGPRLDLAPIRVPPPNTPPTLQALGVPPGDDLQACGTLGLWAVEPDRTVLAPGESIHLRWVWEALAETTEARQVQLSLENPAGSVVQTWEVPLSAAWWPTDRWRSGERWVGRPAIRLPGSLESGTYMLRGSLPVCEPLFALPLQVVAPERVWTVPDSLTDTDWVFGSVIRLAGYSLSETSVDPGTSLNVNLAWQALDEIEISYRVFVHLVDDGGRLVGQHDGEPGDWTRPTTGWAGGEVVVETRTINVPADADPGRHTLRVGLYEAGGRRLHLPDGSDAARLGEIIVP